VYVKDRTLSCIQCHREGIVLGGSQSNSIASTFRNDNLAGRIAAGRILGSDVLGGRDEISRDIATGATQFDLFLSAADYGSVGGTLSQETNAAAPNPWNGYRLVDHETELYVWRARRRSASNPPARFRPYAKVIHFEQIDRTDPLPSFQCSSGMEVGVHPRSRTFTFARDYWGRALSLTLGAPRDCKS